jgi:uncharacterized membrane protein
MLFLPLMLIYFLIFLFGLVFLFLMVQVGFISLAFQKLGIPPQRLFSLLFFSLIGSFINIPIARFEGEPIVEEEVAFSVWGMPYRVRMPRMRETVLAVNLGGAVIPALISLYLWIKLGFPWQPLLGVALVALVTHRLSRPVKGVGIVVPLFIPPILAALVALTLFPAFSPPMAYISGTMGTLIGADIMNLKRVKQLGAPMASIGGAGTFDGIFLTGIIAVLLA